MSRALYIAATGMHAQQRKIDVTANNLANVNTDGFKRSRAEFQDLMYQTLRSSGAPSSRETEQASGLQIGLGVRTASTKRDFAQGDLKNTENPLDLAISGTGFFQVRMPDGELGYTRAGAFKLDNNGRVVTPEGYPLEPQIRIPRGVFQVQISEDGIVSGMVKNRPAEFGTIQLASVMNTDSLEAIGQNLHRINGERPRLEVPGRNGMGSIRQHFLEGSNVRVVEEMISMIVGQRAYEANSKVIQTADRMLEESNRLR